MLQVWTLIKVTYNHPIHNQETTRSNLNLALPAVAPLITSSGVQVSSFLYSSKLLLSYSKNPLCLHFSTWNDSQQSRQLFNQEILKQVSPVGFLHAKQVRMTFLLLTLFPPPPTTLLPRHSPCTYIAP